MALRNPPLYLQAGSHTAENDRLHTAALMGTSGVDNAPGFLPQTGGTYTGDMAVNASGSGLTVTIAAGGCYVAGTSTSTQGTYFVYNDSTASVTLPAAPASNSRIDLIVCRINDAAYTGSTNSVTFEYVQGTASVSPVAPSAPVSSLILAQVLVASTTTTIIGSMITDKRTRAGLNNAAVYSGATNYDTLTLQTVTSQTGYALVVRDPAGNVLNGFTATGTLISGSGGSYTDIFMLMGA